MAFENAQNFVIHHATFISSEVAHFSSPRTGKQLRTDFGLYAVTLRLMGLSTAIDSRTFTTPLATTAGPRKERPHRSPTPSAGPSAPLPAIRATVKVDGLRYRRGPRTSCDAIGQYPIGTKIEIVSYTSENTTVVNDDP